jgi:hypothetical protein
MPKEVDFFKLISNQTFEEFVALPEFSNTLGEQIKMLSSDYPLRLLGRSGDGDIYITEEEREVNFHILGAPGEGKSKFLEYHIRQDIDSGNGLCLLDPSEQADTIKNVLSYCQAIGFKKIILIDPTQEKLARLAPLNPKAVKRSVEGVMEALSILFDAKTTSTPRIKRYLSALLRVLAHRNLTLKHARYFSSYLLDREIRNDILGHDRDSWTIREVFSSNYKFEQFFSSSVNRLDSLWQEPLASMLSNKEGINFIEAVSQGYVILVNLSPYRLTSEESQLLGIIVLSQIIQAVDVLVNSHWKGVYYLYVDEAGRFATPQIDTLLSYKRKSGLRLLLAHHFNDQFENRKVFNSIVNNARIKVMFNTPNPDDRHYAMKAMGYGGEITPQMASYANQNLPKQHAIIKKNKETPVRIRIPDVPPCPPVTQEFIDSLLDKPFYAPRIRENTESLEPRKASDYKATSKTPLSRRVPPEPKARVRPAGKKPVVSEKKQPIKI